MSARPAILFYDATKEKGDRITLMPKRNKPDVNKAVDSIIKYVEDTINFVKNRGPAKEVPVEITALGEEMNAKFSQLSPQEQAHMLFFAIMSITKLARMESRTGKTFSNSVLMAQTFMLVMNEAVTKMDMDIIDIAFSVEKDPVYTIREGDIDKAILEMQGLHLKDLEVKGNA